MPDEKPRPGQAKCVKCRRRWATRYCDGWNHSETASNRFGSFSFSSQCGYPLCDKCTHETKGRPCRAC